VAWRTVMIQNPAKLRLSKAQLHLDREEGEVTIPLEDITAILLESPQISLTSSLLAACQSQGIAVITCDEKHMPHGVLLPFHPHSRQTQVAHLQQSITPSLRKRLWQKVVQCKIMGQAASLHAHGQDATYLHALAGRVQAGDPDNLEAIAARHYWQALMGDDFVRSHESAANAALNYGYAVVRAMMARAQVAAGLLPTFGIHHHNELNAFNLTDDMMEVLRPVVDMHVRTMITEGLLDPSNPRLSITARQSLANVGNLSCRLDRGEFTLTRACEIITERLVRAIEQRSPALLCLPQWEVRTKKKE
jgi:CRISP-associated protein Cas1